MSNKNRIAPLLTLTLLVINSSLAGAQEAVQLPPYPKIEVKTDAGDLLMELFTAKAPLHVQNFVNLVNEGFYDNTVFHRVVGGFVIQGGGYDTDYKLKPTKKFIANESGNGLSNRRGFIGMARTGEPHSADTQFYINLADNVMLDPRPTRWGYTVFGKITEGMGVIDEIGYQATGAGPAPELSKDVPLEPIVVLSMRVIEQAQAPAEESPPEADAGE